jgi:hypothetical protein
MRDLITHSPDVTSLLAEVAEKLPDYLINDDDGNPVGFAVTKTPTVRKGNETLSIVRCTPDEVKLLASLKNITVLADVPAYGDLLAAMSKTGRAIYDRIHDQTPVDVLDEAGNAIGQHTPPELIGAFA